MPNESAGGFSFVGPHDSAAAVAGLIVARLEPALCKLVPTHRLPVGMARTHVLHVPLVVRRADDRAHHLRHSPNLVGEAEVGGVE